ncbi:hypothetical protein GQ43DRAFT_20352 [Delitschia confertaspora ATCC 74209]|uniref:PHD-finger n=1 Tax=Delitschia confertaspora ATCC 74209 TaxID=1513339 RepID=A0A9P4MST5_9PLEO|nr:hypothetical protein GQ43DRAFT_20352 [Delitschia confertaspora ATCC 74209]
MSESCIVCLGDFVVQVAGHLATTGESLSHDSLESGADNEHKPAVTAKLTTLSEGLSVKEDELVAHLLPCGHNLHNECLKPWVERANSCPICRASFNTVELSTSLGGPAISSYAVKDKQQVADIDPFMIVEEDYILEDEGPYDVCLVCNDFGDASQLMACTVCEQLCHVFCAGLDTMPSRGPWYCQECMENPGRLAAAGRRAQYDSPAAFSERRRRRPRNDASDGWAGVWQSVYDQLHFDLDFPWDDDEPSQSDRPDIHQLELQQWDRRLEIARRNGAGNRFRAAANAVLHRRAVPEAPKAANPESQEELRAWNAFEKAREQLAQLENHTTDSTNHRKRKSVDSSSCASEPREPERKLKRPRARAPQNGESSTTAAQRNNQSALPPIALRDTTDGNAASPGFLEALLKEVQVKPDEAKEFAAQPRHVIIERACSPPGSSPGLSPVYSTSRAITPPTLNLNRPTSPKKQKSPAQSPTYSPAVSFSPYSPAEESPRQGRRKYTHRSHESSNSPPRSEHTSPTHSSLSYSTKREIQRMVTIALKPFYFKKEVNKDEYTDINRDISRLMYERVGSATGLSDQQTREKWQKMAGDEVRAAVKALKAFNAASGSGSGGDDSASPS